MPAKGLRAFTANEINKLRAARWKARTDLIWLCNNILNFPDICEKIQGPFIRHLQKFPYPNEKQFFENDKPTSWGQWEYRPILPNPYSLPGHRRVLILDPRSGLKTSTNCIAHAVQWILNYPDISILIVQATIEKAEDIVEKIKSFFQYNATFRNVFPEHCPAKRVADWGTKQEFKTEAQSNTRISGEATVKAASIDKATTGRHFDVMKFTDIVEPANVSLQPQIIKSFSFMQRLVVRPDSWVDVEGTRYDYSDLYGVIIDKEMALPPEQREWKIHVRGCYVKDTGDKQAQYTPDELTLPYKKDLAGQYISWWPEPVREGGACWPVDRLEAIRRDPVQGPEFPTQLLNDPNETLDETVPFPVQLKRGLPRFITRQEFANVPIVHVDAAVDCAETVNRRSNFSAISVGAWAADGRCYVVDIRHGKWTPEQLVQEVLAVAVKWRPFKVKIEDVAFTRGLMPTFRRAMELSKFFIDFELLKRDNRTSKKDRILNTLNPWYMRKDIIFLDDIPPETKEWLLRELSRFPTFENDDILDTLADLFQAKDWWGRGRPRKEERSAYQQYCDQALRSVMEREQLRLAGAVLPEDDAFNSAPSAGRYDLTGGL